MRALYLSLVIACLIVTGCASNPMAPASNQPIPVPGPDETQIVFMRSTFAGSAISASLHDVTGPETKFIGILANDTKVVYATPPGRYTFMVVSEAVDFMVANLEGGKTYYSIVTPRAAAWKARFSISPIKNGENVDYSRDSDKVSKWLEKNKLVTNSELSLQWFASNMSSIDTKRAKYWPVWQEKTPEALARRTLDPDDGR